MSSEHEVLFSSLSLLSKKKFNKILEIGTFDGVNSFLLSLLFEDSQIKTIDLRSDGSDFENTYNRKGNVSEFINSRNKIISKSSNINFKELNSIKLCNLSEKFDLIWIDGAHGYPMVCIDIINSLKLIDQDGLIMCDDIYKKKVNSDKIYNSAAAFETLVELKKENIIDLELIYKRLGVENNCDEKNRKFVAIFKKLKTNF
jgi:predicted O-methyltransferase YrrM